MKAPAIELLDRIVSATAVAIEIYNKPDFVCCEAIFANLKEAFALSSWTHSNKAIQVKMTDLLEENRLNFIER